MKPALLQTQTNGLDKVMGLNKLPGFNGLDPNNATGEVADPGRSNNKTQIGLYNKKAMIFPFFKRFYKRMLCFSVMIKSKGFHECKIIPTALKKRVF